jgi:hypothetical protein
MRRKRLFLLMRTFRLYGKKRGHRRTGSPTLGSAGEAAFFATLLLLGCGGLAQCFSVLVVPEWKASHGLITILAAYQWWVWLVFMVPLSFIITGAGGLIYALLHWGKSAERQAARSRPNARPELLRLGRNGDTPYPTVPLGADITNSPGTKLKFRLPMANSPGWALIGLLAFCVCWNGIVAVWAVLAIHAYRAGKPDWLLTAFVIPFALIGLAALAFFVRQLLTTAGIGPTQVEISDHPLYAGGRYHIALSQLGKLTMSSMRLSLICEESATYRQGTDTRTETREVFRQELFRREGFEIGSGLPFETELDLPIPKSVMHSFAAAHNEINWTLVVEGNATGWPAYRRVFPIVIHPAAGDDHS